MPMYGLPLSQSDQKIRSVFQSVYNKVTDIQKQAKASVSYRRSKSIVNFLPVWYTWVYFLVSFVFGRLSSVFVRLQNPILLVLSSKNGKFRMPSKPSAS